MAAELRPAGVPCVYKEIVSRDDAAGVKEAMRAREARYCFLITRKASASLKKDQVGHVATACILLLLCRI